MAVAERSGRGFGHERETFPRQSHVEAVATETRAQASGESRELGVAKTSKRRLVTNRLRYNGTKRSRRIPHCAAEGSNQIHQEKLGRRVVRGKASFGPLDIGPANRQLVRLRQDQRSRH